MATSSCIAYSDDSLPVRLDFDTWTPRPHFILVQKTPKSEATDEELRASFEIIGRFLANNPEFDVDAILSFHRGRWYQQHTKKWHAHLCVPLEPYLRRAATQMTMVSSNRLWDGARSVEEGIRTSEAQKRLQYEEYRNICLKSVSSLSSVIPVNLSSVRRDSDRFQLAWTCTTPRIAVLVRSSDLKNLTLADLYNFLSVIRVNAEQALHEHDRSFKNMGCHLCLYARGQNGTSLTTRTVATLTDTGDIQADSVAVGYIQMEETQYLKWLPTNVRHIWLTQFRGASHFVST